MSSTSVKVLITGANSGIGFEAVKALLGSSNPYHIFLGGRNFQKAADAAASLQNSIPKGSEVVPLQIDITSDDSIERAFKVVSEAVEYIDVLINNAGAIFDNEVAKGNMTLRQAWNQTFDVNVSGTQVVTHTFMPLLIKSSDARILFVTSGLSSLASQNVGSAARPQLPAGWPKPAGPVFSAYRSSKTALNALMLEWALTLTSDGIKCWCISPGLLATGLGGNKEALLKMGAKDPSLGGVFIKEVVEGKRDGDIGKVVKSSGVQPW